MWMDLTAQARELLCVQGGGSQLTQRGTRVFKHSYEDKHEADALELLSVIKPFTLKERGWRLLPVGGDLPRPFSVTLGRNPKGLSRGLMDSLGLSKGISVALKRSATNSNVL